MRRELVLLGTRITIDHGLVDRLAEEIAHGAVAHRYAIVTDDTVGPLYLERATAALAGRVAVDGAGIVAATIPAGEHHKTREQWIAVSDRLLEAGCGRDTLVIALGGGVVGDLAGFVAATLVRGVPFVQIPTTLLAMVDASVGGKTGVDTPAGKNLIGAFHQPVRVLIDPETLRTLPPRELRAGFAEVVKHGVIADPDYFAQAAAAAPAVRRGLIEESDIGGLIAGSVSIKAGVVESDELEQGARRILNFGHTIAHAVEAVTGFRVLHGEAVAIGMMVEARIAERAGVAAAGLADEIAGVLAAAGLPVGLDRTISHGAILAATRSDKKARGGKVEYALPSRIGEMEPFDDRWSTPVEDRVVLDALAAG
jgi:3-dehydroquinate synthase